MSYANHEPYFPPPPGQSGAPPPLPPRSTVSEQAWPHGQYQPSSQPAQYGHANQTQPAQTIDRSNVYGAAAPPLPPRPAQQLSYTQHQLDSQGGGVQEPQGRFLPQPQPTQEYGHSNIQTSYGQYQVAPTYHYYAQPNNQQQIQAVPQVQSFNQSYATEQYYPQSQHHQQCQPNPTASYSTEQRHPAPHLPVSTELVYRPATILSSAQGTPETRPQAWKTSYGVGQYASQPAVSQQGNVQLSPDAHGLSTASHVPTPASEYVPEATVTGSRHRSHDSSGQYHVPPQSVDDRDQLEAQRPEVQAVLRQRQIDLGSANNPPLGQHYVGPRHLDKRDQVELERPEVQAILRQRQIDLQVYQKQNPVEVQRPIEYSRQAQHVEHAAYPMAAAYQHSGVTGPNPPASEEHAQAARPVAYNPAVCVESPQPQSGSGDIYYVLDGGRVVKGQTHQQQPTNLPSQQKAPQVPGDQVSGGQPGNQNSRTSKWMSKLNDLSVGLSKLQLQLASPPGSSSTAMTAATPQAHYHPQIALLQPQSVEVHQSAPHAHGEVAHTQGNTHQVIAAPLPPNAPPAQYQPGPPIANPETQPATEDLGPEAWIRPVPRMTTYDPPNSIIFECPESRAIDYQARWYHLPSVPDFLICTRCHEEYLSNSSILASKFQAVTLTGKEEDGEDRGVRKGGNICRFNVPRLTRLLIPRARVTGDLVPVEEFMKRRLTINSCTGNEIVKASGGVRWYGVTSMTTTTGVQLPDIWQYVVICEACYEDRILGTSFASRFQPLQRTQLVDQEWKCDLGASSFILRSLLHYSHQATLSQNSTEEEDWLSLTTSTSPYWSLPACSGPRTAVEPATRAWFRAASLPSLIYCEKCYLDKIKHTYFEEHFSPIAVTSKTGSAWMDFALGYTTVETPLYTCRAQDRPMLIALEYTLSRRDITAFLAVAEKILESPVCTDQGLEDTALNKLTGGKWYRFSSGECDDRFRICEACHACLASAISLDRYFEVEPPERAEGKRLVCSLHTGAPRGREFLLRYTEAVDVGVWERFEGFVKVWIDIPVCPRWKCEEGSKGLRWFGWEDCLVCRECWVLFCQPTMDARGVKMVAGEKGGNEPGEDPLVGQLDIPVIDEFIADARMCCMYSPRMRGLFLAVVEEKSQPAQDITRSSSTTLTPSPAETALLTHARHRHVVYAATIPQVRMIQQMREMQMLSSLNSGMVGLMYQGAGAMQSISGNTDGYLHGNGSVGWHETENHATSAAFFDKSRAEGAAVIGGMGGDMMRVMMLMKEWEAVE